jgi:hypothetical protein
MKLRLVAAVALAAGGLMAVRAGSGAEVSPDRFLLSFWCAPPADHLSATTVKQIADAGFNVIFPPCSGAMDTAGNRALLDLAHREGLKVLVSDARLSTLPISSETAAAVARDYASHPALYGYFITDEPSAKGFAPLAASVKALRRADPHHLAYINLFPNYASEVQLGANSYEEYVDRFLKQVRPRLLSYDHYALMKGGERVAMWSNLEVIREKAMAANTPFAAIVLSTPHNDYRDPTEADLRFEAWQALAYGARGLLYFTYWTPDDLVAGFRNGIIEKDGTPTAHYAQVQRVNREIAPVGEFLSRMVSMGVFHSDSRVPGTLSLWPGALVQKVVAPTESGGVVIGQFQDRDKNGYVVVANRSPRAATTIELRVRPDMAGVHEIDPVSLREGPIRTLTSDFHAVEVTLEAGQGKLFRVERNPNAPPFIPPAYRPERSRG